MAKILMDLQDIPGEIFLPNSNFRFLVQLQKWLGKPFLAISSVKIILGMLFPTYQDPWPGFGSILAWSVLRNSSKSQGV